MDHRALDLRKDKNIIIPRALYMSSTETFEADITLLETLYSREQIARELQLTKESINNKVCLWVSERYHIQPFARFRIRR
jgi:hypothetical protein